MKNTILLLAATTIFFGCSKSESGTNTTVTMQSLAGNYKITAATVRYFKQLSHPMPTG